MMKRNIETYEELLKKFACSGDAHAFFSLGSTYFQARYLKERGKGENHQNAQTHVLAEAIELLEELQNISFAGFDAWFDGRCIFPSASEDDNPEIVLDKEIATDTVSFLSFCNRELIRTSSELKQRRMQKSSRFPYILIHNKMLLWIVIVIGCVGFVGGGTYLLIRFNAAISISLVTKENQFSFQYPPASMFKKEEEGLLETFSRLAGDTITDSAHSITDSLQSTSVQSETSTDTSTDDKTPSSKKRKSLPPIVPKARLKVVATPQPQPPPVPQAPPASPPPPTQPPEEPIYQETPAIDESVTPLPQSTQEQIPQQESVPDY